MSRDVVVYISPQWRVTIEVSCVDGVGINGQPVVYVQFAGRRVVDVDGVPRVVVWPYFDALCISVFLLIGLLVGVGDLGDLRINVAIPQHFTQLHLIIV